MAPKRFPISYFLGPFALSGIQRVLASPTPRISSPEIDTLSFFELAQQTFQRILELGFLRGIVFSLLILGCLVLLLICVLGGLATYLRRNDTNMREKLEVDQFEKEPDRDNPFSTTDKKKSNTHEACNFRPQTRDRISRYILSHPNTYPVTKINVRPSPRRANTTIKPSSPSTSSYSPSSPQTPTTLRSALSKSPPRTRRFSSTQSFVFGFPRRASRTPSPKSVRWADQIQVSVAATVQMSLCSAETRVLAEADTEMDIGIRGAEQ